ncbi:MAG: TetR/AcrR family transcriptional regulator [Myxococcota bacterium]
MRERKKHETRRRLLAEARRLFASPGYFATSIEQIAQAADVAPATLFNYFPSKDALVAELAGEVFETLREQLDRAPAPDSSTQAHLGRALADALPAIREARDVLGPLLLRVLRRAASDGARGGLSRLHGALSRLCVAGQRRGDVRGDVEASFLAELASATLLAALGHWLNDPRYPLDARMCQAAAVIGDGLRVPMPTHTRRDP